ncbi:TonB-dependent receptor [Spirosoma sp. BT702]|uniref:TonB-dependent receptor n=1 Tax=Spirosoma profusum TaxID=2771354 RepID=A0A926Y1R0_9BACT|nr:TonB-dependent receptor [Spirosoma profusum]MBD2702467.1 TonB-dependent receptor [Spirosoma profusum]
MQQPLFAQPGSGQISGQLITQDKVPVAFATVMLANTNYNATSDTTGSFTLSAPAGQYTIVVSKVGLKRIERSIVITAGRNTELKNLVLLPDGDLGEVVVRGKNEVRQINEQGFAVNAIDLKTVYGLNRDLNQVLNTTTGIRIREEGGLGSNFNFSLNGFSGNQVKFFLDGIPIDNFGSSLTLNNFPANAAERIEVYKGVLPVSLGTDALGGAVNIVSRRNPNYLDASYSFGSFNTHRVALNGAYTNAKTGFTVRANTFFNYSDNKYRVLVPIKNLATSNFGPDQWVRRYHDDYQSATMQLEAGVTNKPFADRLLIGLIASGNDKDVQTGVVMERVFGAITSHTRTLIPTVKYKKKDLWLNGLDLNLYAAYNMTRFTLIDTTAREYNWLGQFKVNPASSTSSVGGERSRTRNQNKDHEGLLTANLTYRIDGQQTLALNYVGTNFHRSSYDPENPDAIGNRFPSDLAKNALGLAWNLDIHNKFTTSVFGKFFAMKAVGYQQVDAFTAQERYEATTFNYSNPGYGLATAYFLHPTIQVKGSYEHAYRMPEGSEIFGDGVFVVYSVGLKPEKSDNINLGAHYATPAEKDHRITAETGLIYRLTKDFIRLDQSVSGAQRQNQNRGKVRTTGIEAELAYYFKKRLFVSVNGTYQSIIDKQEFEQSSGFTGGVTRNITYNFRLPNLPYLFGNANVGLNLPTQPNRVLTLAYNMNYVEKYYLVFAELGESAFNQRYIIPTQVAHNLSAAYSLANGKYNLALECRNFTDNLLYDSYRLQKPGRSFSVKFRYFISN